MSPAAGKHEGPPITECLRRVGSGDRRAGKELLGLVYEELRAIARGRVARVGRAQTVQATDLVHEAWIRLFANAPPGFENRAHFFGAAANAMRNILVEQARRKGSRKRDVSRKAKLSGDLPEVLPGAPVEDVLSLHEALGKLESAHERPAKVVSLHFFAGLSMPEVAEVAGVSLATAERDWKFARSWLQREMGEGGR
ncbi:MAG: ECF-type sigma factor [Planctomycetes bacterium]|nr:ECF-type sigma factor [Planctomycetota bacterium]